MRFGAARKGGRRHALTTRALSLEAAAPKHPAAGLVPQGQNLVVGSPHLI